MKKLVALFLALTLCLSLCACGNNGGEVSTDTSATSSQTENVSSTASQSESQNSSLSETASSKVTSVDSSSQTPSTTQTSSTSSTTSTTSSTTSVTSSAPVHTHTYSAATCTEPQKCSCGETKGTALGHKWTAATCTAPKTCSICNVTEGSVENHKYSNGKCSVCKAVDEKNYVVVNSKDKTFNILVPKTIADKCSIRTGLYGDSVEFISESIEFEFVATRTMIFEAVKNSEAKNYEDNWKEPFGDQFGTTTNEKMGFKLQKVASNDKYTVFCQYIHERSYASGSTDDLKDFNAILDARENLVESLSFN